jgi:hypothetical protein
LVGTLQPPFAAAEATSVANDGCNFFVVFFKFFDTFDPIQLNIWLPLNCQQKKQHEYKYRYGRSSLYTNKIVFINQN